LLTKKGEVKITDFGISKEVADEQKKGYAMPAGRCDGPPEGALRAEGGTAG